MLKCCRGKTAKNRNVRGSNEKKKRIWEGKENGDLFNYFSFWSLRLL
jgi:hypothetical protein